jgi:hypothetical protein
MGKKTGKNQQRAAAKKKRRTDRLKKRSSGVGGIDGYQGNLSSADEYVMNMSDEEFDEYFSNLRPTLPEQASEEPEGPILLPMWEYDAAPDWLERFQEEIPGITEEEALAAMMSIPIRVRYINGLTCVVPPYLLLRMDEHATGAELLVEAKRWHDTGMVVWHTTELTHIVVGTSPSGPITLDEIDIEELNRFVV